MGYDLPTLSLVDLTFICYKCKIIEVKTSECREGAPKEQPNEVGMKHDTFTRCLHLSIFQTCYMVSLM